MRILPLALLLFAACAGSTPAVVTPSELPTDTFEGRLSFGTRQPTERGASQAEGQLPAVRVALRALDGEGNVVGEGMTDGEGRYALQAAVSAQTLEIRSELQWQAMDLRVATEGTGREPHVHQIPIGAPRQPLETHFADAQPIAGALHILDALRRGSEAVKAWTDRDLPPFSVYWGRGVTTEWSFYTGENSLSERYSVELLGGEPGRQNTTDTDEHDEAIVLHEFGHFVFDVLSSDSSHGGSHPRDVRIEPGLAWEEGRATWFATAVLGVPRYEDTIGVEPQGSLRVNHDLEGERPEGLRGRGSEETVSEVLWDLSDGAQLPDSDQDGADIGPEGVMQAMIAMAEEPGAFPCLGSFLRYLVDTQRLPEQTIVAMLAGRQPADVLFAAGEEWPRTIDLGEVISGKIDGLSEPAPSGGPARPSNGFDAVHVYRVHVPEAMRLNISLRIFGSGQGSEHTDIDLELRDQRSSEIARSLSETPQESINRRLEGGWYMIYVRDAGRGNRAPYELTVRRE